MQVLAKTRLADAKALLGRKRWSAAYYLTGYAVECALKSCLLHHIHETGVIFKDQKYLKELGGCWTHDFVTLVKISGLDEPFGVARGQNPVLEANWTVTKDWKETSRYEEKTEHEARSLYTAVEHEADGVLAWVRQHW